MFPCRVIFDRPGEGAWNMAVDEVLLNQAVEQGIATLRFYQWSEPTLSLGYFQPYEERRTHAASLACAAVRRHSGGGAIVHDRELTYSLSLPRGCHPARDPHALYMAVHQSLRDTLIENSGGKLAGRIDLCGQVAPPESGGEPFLCFRRRAIGDLLGESSGFGLPQTIDGRYKIAGSSQRKRRGAVLQHGSILLGKSLAAPQLPGLAEVAGLRLLADDLARRWSPPLAETLGLGIQEVGWSEDFRRHATGEQFGRFAQPAWTQRR